ncbi:MAG TPA: hypothetical protein VGG42_12075 [Acidobacteriaceae bacterium]
MALSLRNISLGMATASFLLAGSAMAQNSQPMQSSQTNGSSAQEWQLKGANARLDRALDAQSTHSGQVVGAKLDHGVKMTNGSELPGGTQLWGKVEKADASQNGGPSSLTLRFMWAQLKNGQKVPVKVTVIAAFPPSARSSYLNSMGGELPPAPRHINPNDRYTQEPGMLRHIGMKSAVQAHNSATFTDQSGNVKLARGTYLQLAIAERNSAGQTQRSVM